MTWPEAFACSVLAICMTAHVITFLWCVKKMNDWRNQEEQPK